MSIQRLHASIVVSNVDGAMPALGIVHGQRNALEFSATGWRLLDFGQYEGMWFAAWFEFFAIWI